MENELSIEEMQSSLASILRFFDRFCRENGITYYLSGGTMLGAIRHKGFIPWDDDADIMMPRADYERLLSLDPQNERFGFYSLKTTPSYTRPWARMTDRQTKQCSDHYLIGDTDEVFIDIMPMDGLPSSAKALKRHYQWLRIADELNKGAKRSIIPKTERMRLFKHMAKAFIGPKGARKIAIAIDRHAQKYPFEGSAYRGVAVINHYGVKEKLPAEAFEGNIDVEFEDMRLMLFSGYEHYLKSIYGDYMQLPPEEKRINAHRTRYIRLTDEQEEKV